MIPLGHNRTNGAVTQKSTSKLRSAPHISYLIVTPCVTPYNPKRNPNNHYRVPTLFRFLN